MGAEERQPRQTSKKGLNQGGRILIADDESTIRTALVELLQGEGYETPRPRTAARFCVSSPSKSQTCESRSRHACGR
jgi:hypothetical protein